jgi:membrane protease YdiL (CAAX protease family)
MKQQIPLIQKGWMRALVFLIAWLMLQLALNGVVYLAIQKYFTTAGTQSLSLYGLLLMAFISLLANLGITWIFRKNIDRQSFTRLGFQVKGAETHAWTGIFVAVFVIALGTFVLSLADNLRYLGVEFNALSLLLYLLLMVLIAIGEEVVIRGYILSNLLDSFPKWLALLISALLFSLFHFFNPSFNLLSLLGIFTGGLVLGVNYIYTRNLWYGIFFHFAWNFLQGPLLGYQVSGIEMESLLVPSIHGASWWTGGAFGFEASLMAIVFNLMMAIFLYKLYQRKHVAVLQAV